MQHQKTEQLIDKKYAYQILQDMITLLKKSSTMVDIKVSANGHVTVCGDIHGQFYDLLNIFFVEWGPIAGEPLFVQRGLR